MITYEVKHGPLHIGFVQANDLCEARRKMRRMARERRYVWLALWNDKSRNSNTHLVRTSK